MNALFTILADPKFSNDLQAFNNPDQVLLPRRFRPFTQPRERRSVSIVVDRDQRLQSSNCLVFQAVNEALVCPLSGASTCGQANFFQSDRRRKQNASLAQVIDHHGDNSVAPISACGFPKCSFGDGSIILPSKGPNLKVGLEFAEMRPASL
jgi:hypothetical protein